MNRSTWLGSLLRTLFPTPARARQIEEVAARIDARASAATMAETLEQISRSLDA